ncbi:MAG: DUF2806 domain-containing protein [Patescibacteria group bacterium]
MFDPTSALSAAVNNSTKVAGTPFFATIIDKLLGFKVSEWGAQGEVVKKQILEGFEEAKRKGLGLQYVSTFRSSANLINVGTKVARYIDPAKKSEVGIENDVFWGLLDHAQTVSNDEMQEVIAKILAGEYNKPGTYSMSTLQILKSLSKKELEKMSFFGSFYLKEHGFLADFFSMKKDAYNLRLKLDVDYSDFLDLQNLGLIQAGDYTRSWNVKKIQFLQLNIVKLL